MRIEPTDAPFIDVDDLGEDVGEGDSAGSAAVLNQKNPEPQEEEVEPEPVYENEDVPSNSAVVPNFRRKSIREVARIADELGLDLESSGSGFAAEQSIAPGEIVEKGTKIRVEFSP